MLRSDEWKAWLAGQNRFLWIQGIPGAGKTILASRLIETIKEHCEQEDLETEKCAYVYYYCYFGHNQDEATPFLKWTVDQLCREAECVPACLYKLYKHGGQPSIGDLLDGLEAIVKSFDCVYIVLDALDESMPKDDLLGILRDLATDPRFLKIHVLATSRQYIEIERVMSEISVPVSMRNPLLDEDIRLFVRAQIRTNPKLKRWLAALQNEVLEALSTKAKGM